MPIRGRQRGLSAAVRRPAVDKLPADHACALAFFDETGAISTDRFFAVGMLKLRAPAALLREVSRLRDRERHYEELHWKQLTRRRYPIYREALALTASAEALFACFIVDKQVNDPIARFGDQWKAYEKLATQLLHGNIRYPELVTVLADHYSSPPGVEFEADVKAGVNSRLGRLAVTTVCRLDSRSTDGLQLVDLLLGAVVFEHKLKAGLADANTRKAKLARDVLSMYGVDSTLTGAKVPGKLSVALYRA